MQLSKSVCSVDTSIGTVNGTKITLQPGQSATISSTVNSTDWGFACSAVNHALINYNGLHSVAIEQHPTNLAARNVVWLNSTAVSISWAFTYLGQGNETSNQSRIVLYSESFVMTASSALIRPQTTSRASTARTIS